MPKDWKEEIRKWLFAIEVGVEVWQVAPKAEDEPVYPERVSKPQDGLIFDKSSLDISVNRAGGGIVPTEQYPTFSHPPIYERRASLKPPQASEE